MAKVTPWEVEGKIDYDKLVQEFGTKKIDASLRKKIAESAGEEHVMLRREFFYSHRDLDLVLKEHKAGKGFFLYTGRGPSGDMHLGHLIPLIFTKWLQDKFDVNLYIQLTDDEKFLHNRKLSWEDVEKYSIKNALDIAAVGFNPQKTFIFRDSEYAKNAYPLLMQVARKITFSTAKAVFGFTNETSVGMINYPSYQIVPSFFEKKRCLIPCAIDQDPYWRIQRDIAESLGFVKAAAVHSKFFPPLQGVSGKMSASNRESAIWLDDSEKDVRKKVMKYAFSGGRESMEEHRKEGGNVEVDVSFQWLKMLFEPNDKELKHIESEYSTGAMLSGELKQILVDKVNAFLSAHRTHREKINLDEFMYSGKLATKMWETTYKA